MTLGLRKKANFVASCIREFRVNILCTDWVIIMKSSLLFITKKKKLFKRYEPESVKKTEVSWMLLRETRFWKGGEHSDCGLWDSDTV